MHLKMTPGNCQPLCLGFIVLNDAFIGYPLGNTSYFLQLHIIRII